MTGIKEVVIALVKPVGESSEGVYIHERRQLQRGLCVRVSLHGLMRLHLLNRLNVVHFLPTIYHSRPLLTMIQYLLRLACSGDFQAFSLHHRRCFVPVMCESFCGLQFALFLSLAAPLSLPSPSLIPSPPSLLSSSLVVEISLLSESVSSLDGASVLITRPLSARLSLFWILQASLNAKKRCRQQNSATVPHCI